MLRNQTTKICSYLLTGIFTLLAMSGCGMQSNWLDEDSATASDNPVILGAPQITNYLDELHKLSAGDPATQIEILSDAEAESQLTPNTSTLLRYALILGTPGHSGNNNEQAQGMLSELLVQRELMTAPEVALAELYLKNIENRIVLNNESERLRQQQASESNADELAMERQISRLRNENRRLQQALDEAEAKLDAITSIEQSIRQSETSQTPQ